MKNLWIIPLAFILTIAPVFATTILNPSFELTQSDSSGGRMNPNNLTIPLNWFSPISIDENNTCLADRRNWVSFVTSFVAFEGNKSMNMSDDDSGAGFTTICQNFNLSESNFTLTFYIKDRSSWGNFIMGAYWINSSMTTSTSVHAQFDSTGFGICTFDSCNFTNAGGGWEKVRLYKSDVTGMLHSSLWFDFNDIDLAQMNAILDDVQIGLPPITPPSVIGSFALSPLLGSHQVGTPFTINMTADSGGMAIDGVDVLLAYDGSKLSVTNIAMVDGLLNITYQNYTGSTITFSKLSNFGTQTVVNGTLATITFMPTNTGNASVNFLFTLGNTTDSNMAVNGTDILNSTTNGIYSISAAPSPPSPPPIQGSTAAILLIVPLLAVVGLVFALITRVSEVEHPEELIKLVIIAVVCIGFLTVLFAVIGGLT